MMETAFRLGRAWHDVSYNVGAYFLRRWRRETTARQGFGLNRWASTRDSDLFQKAREALSASVRSPGSRARTVDMVIGQPLSSGEIDVLLRTDPEIDLALAVGLAGRGRYAEAEERFARAFKAEGDLPREGLAAAHVARAQSLLALGRIDEALGELGRTLASRDTRELEKAVALLGRLKIPENATLRFADRLKALPREIGGLDGSPAYVLALGKAEIAAGRTDSGTELLLKHATATDDASLYAELAVMALARGRPEQAVLMSSRAASIEPRASHELLLSRAFMATGDTKEAASALRRALALEPLNVTAVRNLAGLELRMRRPDQAERLCGTSWVRAETGR